MLQGIACLSFTLYEVWYWQFYPENLLDASLGRTQMKSRETTLRRCSSDTSSLAHLLDNGLPGSGRGISRKLFPTTTFLLLVDISWGCFSVPQCKWLVIR